MSASKVQIFAVGIYADIIMVFVFLLIGVSFSSSLTNAIRTGAESVKVVWPPRLGKVIFSAIIAIMLVATTDLIQGDDGKLKPAARIRRYASAFYSGITWRLIIEAA